MRHLPLWLGAVWLIVACLPPPGSAQTPPPADRLPVDVTGASDIEYDAQTQQYQFRGTQVVVVRGDQRLVAAEILYDGGRRLAVLPQGGTISTPTMELSSDRITADLGHRHFLAEGHVAGRLLENGRWATLHAAHLVADDRPDLRRAEADGDVVAVRGDQELRADRLVYDRVTGTSVLSGHASVARQRDSVHADRITVHLDRNEAIADGHVRLMAYPREGPEAAQP
jgi:lipopolysaccharide export system protein LptA